MSKSVSAEEFRATIQSILDATHTSLESVASVAEVDELEREVVGKKGSLTRTNSLLGAFDISLRQALGAEIQTAKEQILTRIEAVRRPLMLSEMRSRLNDERIDITELIPSTAQLGSLHPTTVAIRQLEQTFIGMGFNIEEGPIVEDDFHNFTALNLPPGHPARSGFDSMFVDFGKPESTLLRTHTSPVQVRVMETHKPPIYSVMPGRVFRRDTPDARHLAQFHQIEGLVVDEGVTFGDLAGCVDTFTKAYFGGDINSRLRPGSFPFTEPSAELDISCTVCRGKGCRTCSQTGWVELGGCGMVHPNVFRAVGVDEEKYSGFAFGFGIERLVFMRYQFPDIRILLENDVRFLEQFV